MIFRISGNFAPAQGEYYRGAAPVRLLKNLVFFNPSVTKGFLYPTTDYVFIYLFPEAASAGPWRGGPAAEPPGNEKCRV